MIATTTCPISSNGAYSVLTPLPYHSVDFIAKVVTICDTTEVTLNHFIPPLPSLSLSTVFTLDADLLSLDLNPQSQSKPLTSIQELLLNERLVVNRSTWMDSELLELGGAGGVANNTAAAETSSQTSSQPSTPRTSKKQNSIEHQLLELGLDVSKTTLAKDQSRTELSLTARTTLGRLPDLSFMLQTDKLVHSTYQPGQGTG